MTQPGDILDVYVNNRYCTAKVLAVLGTLALLEYQRGDGTTGLYQTYRSTPWAIQRQYSYHRLPLYWKEELTKNSISWLGRPRGAETRILTDWERERHT